MPNVRIAILSDLHVGEHAREFDMRPGGTPRHAGHKGYVEQFREFVQANSITADMLVVSGDITNGGKPSQFDHAAKIIRELGAALGVPADCVFAVPGNHDVNWDIAKLATETGEPFWNQYIFAPYREGHIAIGCSASEADALVKPPHFNVRRFPEADFWSFNSAAYDMPDLRPHRGSIQEKHRSQFRSALASAYDGSAKRQYRILVTHHHLTSEPDIYGDDPDFSAMVNGDNLLDLLMDFKFDLVLHGHKHRPWSRNFVVGGGHPILLWCSGSFSQTLGPEYAGIVGNLWHMVELQGMEPVPNAYGVVRSWAYAPTQGWVASRKNEHGVPHVTPFGYLADRPTIEGLIRHAVEKNIRDKPFVEWDTVCDSSTALRYQSGKIVWSILEGLAPDLGFRIHGEQNSLDRLLLLKEVP